MAKYNIANALDLAVLRPTTRVSDIARACDMAQQEGIRTVASLRGSWLSARN